MRVFCENPEKLRQDVIPPQDWILFSSMLWSLARIYQPSLASCDLLSIVS